MLTKPETSHPHTHSLTTIPLPTYRTVSIINSLLVIQSTVAFFSFLSFSPLFSLSPIYIYPWINNNTTTTTYFLFLYTFTWPLLFVCNLTRVLNTSLVKTHLRELFFFSNRRILFYRTTLYASIYLTESIINQSKKERRKKDIRVSQPLWRVQVIVCNVHCCRTM